MTKVKKNSRKTTSTRGWMQTFKLRRVLVLNLLILSFITWGFIGELMRSRSIDAEIDQLNTQVSSLEKRNAELTQIADRLTGSALLEREARLKLNLRRPGESVVIIRDEEKLLESSTINGSSSEETSVAETSVSNYHKWIRHFFPTK